MNTRSNTEPLWLEAYWSRENVVWLFLDEKNALSAYPETASVISTRDTELVLEDLPNALQNAIYRVRETKTPEKVTWVTREKSFNSDVSTRENGVFIIVQSSRSVGVSLWHMYDNLPVGILATDENFTIGYANEMMSKIVDVPVPSSLLGLSALDFIHPDDLKITERAHSKQIAEKLEFQEYIFRRQSKDGNIRWYKATFGDSGNDSPYRYLGIVAPIEEEKAVERRLRKSESRLRSIFYNAQGGLVLSNGDLQITASNAAFCEMLGYESELELRGKHLPTLTFHEDRKEEKKLFDDLVQNKKSHYRIEKRYVDRTGNPIWCDVIVSAIWDEKGKALNYISIIQNIQQSKEDQDRLEKLNEMKDKFFSVLSHDLKNPINAILGLTDLTRHNVESGQTEEIGELLNLIESSTRQVQGLLTNVLDWSRSQQSHMPFKPVSIQLEPFCGEVEKLMEINLREKNQKLNIQFNGIQSVVADHHMLNSIMNNLISNAIKFSHNDSQIDVEFSEELGRIRVSISDGGVGMPSELVRAIVDRNSASWSLGTKQESGTGLGLILVQDFLSYHDSKLEIVSEQGKGSRFSFVIG